MNTATHTGRPGRPRNPDVIARDEHIYALIKDGLRSRSELAQQAGLDRDAVYLSCRRLHKQGRIRQCSDHGAIVWSVADDTRCP